MAGNGGWKWFGVKSIYRTQAEGAALAKDELYRSDFTLLEERVVLIRARNQREAYQKAEQDAEGYVQDSHRNVYGQKVVTRCLGVFDVYKLLDEEPASGVEIFSSTEAVSSRISDEDLIQRLMLGEPEEEVVLRRNILDLVFEPRLAEVDLTVDETEFIDWLKRRR